MKVWTRVEKYTSDSERPLVLALGNFDGVHRGHQEILAKVLERSRMRKGTAAVLTFFEHPQRVLHGSREPGLLTSPQHRLLLLEAAGVESCFFLHFTLPLSQTSPEDFVREWLVKRLRVSEVHLGYNAHFGFNRRGDCDLMRKLSGELGFSFFEAGAVKEKEGFISSTAIRQAILKGDLALAEQLLGRSFSLFASVVRGKGRGRGLGFPTANLRVHSEILPPGGVYPVELRERCFRLESIFETSEFEFEADQPGPWQQGILNFGVRPTFETEGETVPEVHLFDFEGDLYGKTVEVVFYPKLRDEKGFANEQELVGAIQNDINRAREYFAVGRNPLKRETKSAIL